MPFFDVSTVLMAVFATNLLILLLTLCFRNTKLMINAGYKLLALFIIFTVLRFLFPFALPFNIRIFWSEYISHIVCQFYDRLFELAGYRISVWTILNFIWILGICIKLLLYGISYIKADHYINLYAKAITEKEPFAGLIDKICQEKHKPNKFTIIELPDLETPVLYGILKPRILIPENLTLSEQDWYYVLQHEASHHFHHDILMKNIIKLITIIYWWNPFCAVLNRQADVILEMRVDDALTLRDQTLTGNYMECLINVSEHSCNAKSIPKTFTMSILPTETSDIRKRFEMLISNQTKRHLTLNISLAMIALSIYILSYVFIIEAFQYSPPELDYVPDPNSKNTMIIPAQMDTDAIPSENIIYAVQREDGTYDLYYDDGIYLDSTDSLEFYPRITVYTEETNPYK